MYRISNDRCHVNGWTSLDKLNGKVVAEVEMPLKMPSQWLQAVLVLLCGGAMAFAGRKLFVRTQPGVPFAPITSQNTHLLPAAESLVRPSMPGPQIQQAELLRSAPSVPESAHQNQLLHATQSPHGPTDS